MKYNEEFGTCNIPNSSSYQCVLEGMCRNGEDYDYNCNLGSWLNNQRKAKREYKDLKLTSDREARLQQLVDAGV